MPDLSTEGEVNVVPKLDEQIESVLAGMPYPARLWEIIAWAEFNGAWPTVLDALHTLPVGKYSGVRDIVDAIRAGETLEAAGRACHHRRHPRFCSGRHEHPHSLTG